VLAPDPQAVQAFDDKKYPLLHPVATVALVQVAAFAEQATQDPEDKT